MFPQRPENESAQGKVMEHENLTKVMEFCDQSWNFTNFDPEFYLRNLASVQKICISNLFCIMSQNLSSEMVMENQETVMEKS